MIISYKIIIIVALSAVFVISVTHIGPAFAASKVLDETNQFPFSLGSDQCLPGSTSTGTATFHIVIWDNGVSILHFSGNGIIQDSSGTNIGHYSLLETGANGTQSLPFTVDGISHEICNGSGIVSNFHFHVTVDQNGKIHFFF